MEAFVWTMVALFGLRALGGMVLLGMGGESPAFSGGALAFRTCLNLAALIWGLMVIW